MSKNRAQEVAARGFRTRFAPVDIETQADIAVSVGFGPFEPGDYIVITLDAPANVNVGPVGGAAIATNPLLPAGVHDFAVPFVEGETELYIHLLGTNGCAFKAS